MEHCRSSNELKNLIILAADYVAQKRAAHAPFICADNENVTSENHVINCDTAFLVVEVGDVDRALEAVVGIGQLADDLVDPVADLFVALGRHHVGKAAARRNVDQGIGIAGVLVGDVLDEQQDKDVILVLAGIHAAAQLVAGLPEGGIEFGFLDGHMGVGFVS